MPFQITRSVTFLITMLTRVRGLEMKPHVFFQRTRIITFLTAVLASVLRLIMIPHVVVQTNCRFETSLVRTQLTLELSLVAVGSQMSFHGLLRSEPSTANRTREPFFAQMFVSAVSGEIVFVVIRLEANLTAERIFFFLFRRRTAV